VLREIDLSLAAGACTAISASNGAGKSTRLRFVAGLSLPTTGVATGRPGPIGYVPERSSHVVLGVVWIAAQTVVVSALAAAIAHRLARRAA
jgi:ABC-type Mn2+/Zn2+ transport system ATPase subunit